MSSTYFTVDGPGGLKTEWRLEIYPKGWKDAEDCVSLFVDLKEGKVSAEKQLYIIDAAGNEREARKLAKKEHDCVGKKGCWGKNRLWKRDLFNDHPDLLPDGNLTIKCKITVFVTRTVLSGSDIDFGNPAALVHCHCQKQLGDQLGIFFSDKQLSDIKVECHGQTFDCHQAILAARSPVFLAMFQSNMKEKETKTVTIDDYRAEVVSEMLNYIYTGNVSGNDIINEIATELLAAADKYQMDLLKNICEERLCSSVNVTNCVELFVIGDMYQTFKLRRTALRLVEQNMNSIIDTDVFKDLYKRKPELAWEVTKALHKN